MPAKPPKESGAMKGSKAPLPPFSKPTVSTFRKLDKHEPRIHEYSDKVSSHNTENPNDVLDITAAGFLSYDGSDGNLKSAQKGACAADATEVIEEFKRKAKARQGERTDRESDTSRKDFLEVKQSRDEAGDLFGVSGRYVDDAVAVKRDTPVYNVWKFKERSNLWGA